MSINSYTSYITLSFLIVFIIIFECSAQLVSVSTENGKINGKTSTINGKDVNIFLGIPFAEPPIGDLRFKKPVPAKNWDKTLEAVNWPKPCFQIPMFNAIANQNKNFSEDCLYLNIWSPVNNVSNGKSLKPVILWIHGGANIVGSSNESPYNPTFLSVLGDVVVVSINYRLNTFGFLYTGTDDAPGNMALWDQALAMEWVKKNIKKFGGNPNQVTLMGESAGSIDISLHILSPVSRKLFKNAIMMSGAALGPSNPVEPAKAMEYWALGAKLIGCGDEQNSVENIFTPKMIECLKNTSIDKLVLIPNLPQLRMGYVWYLPIFVIDGQFIPDTPLNMLKSGQFKHKTNLLIGTAQDEGSPLLSLFIDPIVYNTNTPKNLTFREAYNALKQMSSQLPITTPINSEEVAKLYFTGLSPNSNRDLLRRTIGIAFGDYAITCPTLYFAKLLFKKDHKNSKVYEYYYNNELGKDKLGFCGDWMGVCHASDISPVFGLPFAQYNSSSNREREVSKQMIKFITDFAKTGKPTPQDGHEWPSYYTVNKIITAPYYEVTSQPKLRSNFDYGLKITECDYLWKNYLK